MSASEDFRNFYEFKVYNFDENEISGFQFYKNLLSNDQIISVLSYIKSKWPSHIRIKHDQLNKVFKEN